MSDCLFFLRYWTICVLQLLANQAVTSKKLKLTLSFWSSRFAQWPKSQDKNVNILRTKRAFEVKGKAFFIIFKGVSAAKNCLRPEIAPLRVNGKFTLKIPYFHLVLLFLCFTLFKISMPAIHSNLLKMSITEIYEGLLYFFINDAG